MASFNLKSLPKKKTLKVFAKISVLDVQNYETSNLASNAYKVTPMCLSTLFNRNSSGGPINNSKYFVQKTPKLLKKDITKFFEYS